MTTWCLWNRRNALHFSRLAHSISKISSVVGSLLQEFIANQNVEPPLPRPTTLHQWCPLEPCTLKVKFDVALFKYTNSAGIGVIVRDWRGAALRALSTPIMLSLSVADMEALMCLRTVQFAAELDLHSVIYEGDSATIISVVSQGSSSLSSFGNIIDDVRCLLPSFSSVKFIHVHHSSNLVANALAKKASTNVGCQVWRDAMPLDIVALIDFDVH